MAFVCRTRTRWEYSTLLGEPISASASRAYGCISPPSRAHASVSVYLRPTVHAAAPARTGTTKRRLLAPPRIRATVTAISWPTRAGHSSFFSPCRSSAAGCHGCCPSPYGRSTTACCSPRGSSSPSPSSTCYPTRQRASPHSPRIVSEGGEGGGLREAMLFLGAFKPWVTGVQPPPWRGEREGRWRPTEGGGRIVRNRALLLMRNPRSRMFVSGKYRLS